MVVANFATTSQHGTLEGKTQSDIRRYYNLDVIISVGYRVKSQRGGGYFKELLDRIRDIRAMEKAQTEYKKYKAKQ